MDLKIKIAENILNLSRLLNDANFEIEKIQKLDCKKESSIEIKSSKIMLEVSNYTLIGDQVNDYNQLFNKVKALFLERAIKKRNKIEAKLNEHLSKITIN